MGYQDESNSELIAELQDLQSKYKLLKSSYEQDILARDSAEKLLRKRTGLLSELNSYSIQLAEQDHVNILQFVAESFKKMFAVRAVWTLRYDEKLAALLVENTTSTESENNTIVKYLGIALKNYRTTVTPDRYKFIIESGTQVFTSLHDISFGQIPKLVSTAIQKLFDAGWFLGVALIDKGKLYGTMVVAGYKDQEELPTDIVKIFAELTSHILRRKETEAKLQASEEKFRKAFFISPDSININRLSDGMYVSVNRGFSKITGYAEEEVVGKTSVELNIWTDLNQRDRMTKILIERGEISNMEFGFRMKDGSTKCGMMSASVIELDGIKHILSITRDITDRKKVEEEIKSSEEKYRLLAENVSDVIWILDTSTMYFTYVSPSVERLRGYTPEEIMAVPMTHALTPEGAKYVTEQTQKRSSAILSGKEQPGTYYTDEVEQPCKDGAMVWTEVVTTFYVNKKNGRVEVLGVTRNITERKKNEQELNKMGKHYQALIEKAPDGIILLNQHGRFKFVSTSARKMFGYGLNEDISTDPSTLTHPDDYPMVIGEIGRLLQDPTYIPTLQYRFAHKNGSWIWVESTFSNLLTEPSVESIVINFRNINDRKLAEDEISKLNVSLELRVNERTSQLEAANSELQAFAYSVSHDLRAPLRAIDGFSKFVLEDYGSKLDPEGQRLLGLIRSNTQKMDKLITDILALSRVTRSEHKKSKIDMTKMALSMFNEVASSEIEGKIEVRINPLPEITGDPTYIKLVWINLISNAIKFSSLESHPEIIISGQQENDYNVYSVKDNGVGFNPEYSHKLFGVFQRLHKVNEFEGTGVGLAIVQRIVHRHGGKVWAESKEGQGATFYFSLPLAT
jgi:PAS domain S-box-containing protein